MDSDEDLPSPPRQVRTKASSRAGSAAPPMRSTRNKNSQSQPLFLSEDEKIEDIEEDEDDTHTLASTGASTKPTTKKPTVSKKRKAIVIDDDSDDGTFKGFQNANKRPTKLRR